MGYLAGQDWHDTLRAPRSRDRTRWRVAVPCGGCSVPVACGGCVCRWRVAVACGGYTWWLCMVVACGGTFPLMSLPLCPLQLLSEKISGAEGTKLDEDFMEMERVGATTLTSGPPRRRTCSDEGIMV